MVCEQGGFVNAHFWNFFGVAPALPCWARVLPRRAVLVWGGRVRGYSQSHSVSTRATFSPTIL